MTDLLQVSSQGAMPLEKRLFGHSAWCWCFGGGAFLMRLALRLGIWRSVRGAMSPPVTSKGLWSQLVLFGRYWKQKTREAKLFAGLMVFLGSLYTIKWCPGSDSNRHALQRGILNPLRLPISPPGQRGRIIHEQISSGKYYVHFSFGRVWLSAEFLRASARS
jgi:hypothetical protein